MQDDDGGGVQVDEGEGLRPSTIFLPPTSTQVGFCDKIVSSFTRSRGHGHVKAGKPDPIGDLIRGVGEGVAKIVGDLERSLQKLVDPKVLLTSILQYCKCWPEGFLCKGYIVRQKYAVCLRKHGHLHLNSHDKGSHIDLTHNLA